LLVAAIGRTEGQAKMPGWREHAVAEQGLGCAHLLRIGCALSGSADWPFQTALDADLRRFAPRFFRAAWGLRNPALAYGSMAELAPLFAEGLALETLRSEPEFAVLGWRGGESVCGHWVTYLTGVLQALGEQAFPGARVRVRLLDAPAAARPNLPSAWRKSLTGGESDEVRWQVRFGAGAVREEGVSAVLSAVVPGHQSSASERVLQALNELGLTRRQAEVALYIAQGMERNAIATKLGLSPETVKHHRNRVMSMLCLRSTVALCRLVWSLE
jgi:DNA-binding CsgD family transcriptional regulator